MTRRGSAASVCLACAWLSTACRAVPAGGPAADVVRSVESRWNDAARARDLDRFVSFYANDASLMAPLAPRVTGTRAIRDALAPLFGHQAFSLSLEPDKVEVAASGDLAYTQGRYAMTAPAADGTLMAERGKYVVVFRKGTGGAWKVVADIFNADAAPVPVREVPAPAAEPARF